MKRVLVLLVAVVGAMMATGCASVYKMDQYDGFGDWFVGRPGFRNTLKAPLDARTHKVTDYTFLHPPLIDTKRRIPLYLHLRLPEIIFQPAGCCWYPQRWVPGKPGARNDAIYKYKKEMEGKEKIRFSGYPQYNYNQLYYAEQRETGDYTNSWTFEMTDAGLIEIIPYRLYTSDAKPGTKFFRTLMHPFNYILQVGYAVVWRVPVYAVHDISKTLMIPVAAIYYITRD